MIRHSRKIGDDATRRPNDNNSERQAKTINLLIDVNVNLDLSGFGVITGTMFANIRQEVTDDK
ncbi:hypothetical protein FF011L_05670 [Roseimaritima multifibrata]|uniref:Uncharacterized protein n=1 Tax=Roseimaritima multifibrata TaxID=1930274 RepID=A0A517MAA9_9BACT|nr:hypothetical protein [Roseimaritima multifibrata]QDS91832.1 hypothetical protein FF011L_05670 [Roseimaritima multifibrata]